MAGVVLLGLFGWMLDDLCCVLLVSALRCFEVLDWSGTPEGKCFEFENGIEIFATNFPALFKLPRKEHVARLGLGALNFSSYFIRTRVQTA
jgi:hypothetical protein